MPFNCFRALILRGIQWNAVAYDSAMSSLVQRIQGQWRELANSQPGRRFQDRYDRRQRLGHGPLAKLVSMFLGLVIVLVGIVLLFIPGPGTLFLVMGAGLIAEESLITARMLDWLEVKVRRWLSR